MHRTPCVHARCKNQKKGDNYILLTVIKHKRGDKEKAIDKRLREKAEYEETMDAFKNYKK